MTQNVSTRVARTEGAAAAPLTLDALDADALREIYDWVRLPIALKLTCRALRDACEHVTDELNLGAFAGPKMLQWAHGVGYRPTHGLIKWAIECDNPEAIKWALDNGFPLTPQGFNGLAKKGYLELLKRARADGCKCDDWTWEAAAEGGHLEVLEWLREIGCEYESLTRERVCAAAAGGGHLKVLKWLRNRGWPWDYMTCGSAAMEGHLEVLEWARANGCKWDKYTCEWAAWRGHLEVLEWARANECPWDKEKCLEEAEKKGHDHVVAWIREQQHQ